MVAQLNDENCALFKQIPYNVLHSTGQCLQFDHIDTSVKLIECEKTKRFKYGQRYLITDAIFLYVNSPLDKGEKVVKHGTYGSTSFRRMYERTIGISVSSGKIHSSRTYTEWNFSTRRIIFLRKLVPQYKSSDAYIR